MDEFTELEAQASSDEENLSMHENQFHPRNYGFKWPDAETADIRAELMRRGLSQYGCREELCDRLRGDNEFVLSSEGRHDIYERKLAVIKDQEAAANLVPFQRFSDLPTELRFKIWKLSLPGPRVLSVSDFRKGSAAMLHFREHDNKPNPAALTVCRESREIALRRYRLCFGTPNIYADLTSDILYFGSNWDCVNVFRNGVVAWASWIKTAMRARGQEMPNVLISDLQQVKNLALPRRMWDMITHLGTGDRVSAGIELRRKLILWVSLKQLILVEDDKKDVDMLFSLTPGHTIFEDSTHPCEDAELAREGFLK
ncbi:uncharacterized protein LY89DRAFT_372847 [Mollisia scopiformis]|uniref:2EXR domain-containing protein n=1 Tax=Mollisia scopiformis TaxID=149040 RepID=A0A132B3I6_MOLSC|nr:uncharacterized protein LY89DRAFT_372847 [Mollisia scopiformis]KUJ06946.1 hypothetical protein LY89DRAFT_372847 [Mollisia scopiformis]